MLSSKGTESMTARLISLRLKGQMYQNRNPPDIATKDESVQLSLKSMITMKIWSIPWMRSKIIMS
eukprot:5050333-Ditylum_brightwellii.AAC.1